MSATMNSIVCYIARVVVLFSLCFGVAMVDIS